MSKKTNKNLKLFADEVTLEFTDLVIKFTGLYSGHQLLCQQKAPVFEIHLLRAVEQQSGQFLPNIIVTPRGVKYRFKRFKIHLNLKKRGNYRLRLGKRHWESTLTILQWTPMSIV